MVKLLFRDLKASYGKRYAFIMQTLCNYNTIALRLHCKSSAIANRFRQGLRIL